MIANKHPKPEQTGAVVMRRYGPPSVLQYEQMSVPPLGVDEIRILTLAAAVNHSDLEIRAGNWPIRRPNPFPYIPGLEFVGTVVEVGEAVQSVEVGRRVVSMMQGLGGVRAKRPGGYAEYVTVLADAAAPIPDDLDLLKLAALGLGGVTALEGLRKLGPLEGRRIAVTGAAGGVGSAAVGIARAQGADVVAIISRPGQADYARELGAVETLLPDDIARGALKPETLDGVLDTVAGASFGAYVDALRPGAALSLVGAVGGSDVRFDAYRLLDITLTGYSSEQLTGDDLRAAIAPIADWLRNGALAAPKVTLMPLRDAAAAHEHLERHLLYGRILLVPDS